ncbi:growth-regulating factor 9 [Diospyros lotus]|uniref:growth-regulating factor 9 n=1 Tax=Diospyros lotus TaxID=55363 RepID=UPI002250417A|nr:growth-regulating factor 9 [Diospyros lotus]
MQPKPLIPDSGKGGGGGKTRWERGKVKEKDHAGGEGSPSIKLGLGIGASGVTKQQGKCGFTLAQWYEFQQQAIICKYIVSGLVVPFYLVLPIWKSVARCFGSANGGIYNHFPSFIGFNLQDFHCKGEMDPEPGRCRRTDGKKWRCSRDVVPNQKYCERHMHRGCQRSRKHVAASVIASQPGTSIDACKTTKTSNSGDITSTKSNLSISSPVDFEFATPSSNTGTNSSATASPTTNSVSDFSRNGNIVVSKLASSTATIPLACYGSNDNIIAGVLSPSAENNRNNNVHVDVKDASYGHLDNRSNINRSSKGVKNSGDGNFAGPGFGSSANGAQQGLGRGSSTWVDNGHGEGTGFRRCRRTDGKKWQCSREVLPDGKYCERHVNRGRGAKKFVVHYQQPIPIHSVSLAPPPLAIPKTAVIPSTADTRMNVDIGLSIAVAASPAPITSDESSDATTITDEISTFSHLVAASP